MAEADRGPARAHRGLPRWLATAIALVLFGTALAETLRVTGAALDAFGVRSPTVDLNLVPMLLGGLDALRAARAGSSAPQIVFLGDSISISTGEGAPSVPEALRVELGDGAGIHSLAALGAGPFDYYFLVDQIAAAHPDAVVVAFTLQSLGDAFRSLSRKGLSGWVAPRRLLEVARAPTHWIGLTADELLFDVAIVQLGGGEAWRRLLVEQARLGVARRAVSEWLGERLGGGGPQAFELARFAANRERTRIPGLDRYDAAEEARHYGAVFGGRALADDHPMLVVLRGILQVLREAKVPVLVVVSPVNVEHLRAVGLLADDRLPRSLDEIERSVRGAGGEWLDLHALLPDASFRDAAGHVGTATDPDAARAVAAAIAPAVRHLVARRDAAAGPADGRSNQTQ